MVGVNPMVIDSKEQRIDPKIVVGLLVYRKGEGITDPRSTDSGRQKDVGGILRRRA
jgi:hypothetical protein